MMRSRLTPAIVIVVSALVTASIIGGELVLLAKFDKVAGTFGLPQLSTTTMPDGTVLTLHYVAFGRNHMLPVPVGRQGFLVQAAPQNMRSVNFSSGSDQLVFLVSRHAPDSKVFLDFESWSHCLATDAFGEQIQDNHPHRFVYSTSSSKSEGRERGPFPPLTLNDRNFPREGRRIFLGIQMKAFRAPAGSTLDFFDVDGNKVASLPFVSPIAGPTAEWEVDSLPATRKLARVDDPTSSSESSFRSQRDLKQPVSLTLKSLELTSRRSSRSNGQTNEYRPLKYKAELQVGGQKTKAWQLSARNVTDVLGNEASFGNAMLSVHEPAWRLSFQASRTLDADFADSERLVLKNVKIAPDGMGVSMPPGVKYDSNLLTPYAAFGRGEAECQVSTPSYNAQSFSTGGAVPLSDDSRRRANYRMS